MATPEVQKKLHKIKQVEDNQISPHAHYYKETFPNAQNSGQTGSMNALSSPLPARTVRKP